MIRVIVVLLLFAFLPHAAPEAAERVFRVASLARTEDSLQITRHMLQELASLGFREGENLIVEEGAGDPSELAELVRTMLDRRPDAIVAVGGEAISAARQVTSTVPIVIFGGPNPVDMGYAVNLAHPGGNVTGVVILGSELDGKRVDLLHEAVPAMRRIAGLFVAFTPGSQPAQNEMRSAAAKIGLEFMPFEVAGPDEYPGAFAGMRAAKVQGVAFMASPLLYRDGAQLAALALQSGMPSVCEWAEMAQVGCLLGYGPDRAELRRRLAHHLAEILRGAAPGGLPIEQPTRYELAVNLKTAKTLGLEIPQSILVRAGEVIE